MAQPTSRLILTLALAASLFSGVSIACPAHASITTAAAVAQASDDAPVVLTGTLTKQISKEKYAFQDASGSVTVEIDQKYMPAQTITPSTTVRLTGKVDKNYTKGNEVDIKMVEIVQ